MREESRKIQLTLGDVSLNKELGSYYIDMRPALTHYTDNIYDGGFDENGVPMCGINGELHYFPINIAQYTFILHANWLENKDPVLLKTLNNCLQVLEKNKTVKNNYCAWLTNYYNKKYNIEAPWPSAMAQGEVISFYLRMYQIHKDDSLINTAIQAYNFLKVEYKDGGVRRYDNNGNLWFEEYPTKEPSFVLNGFIYTIFGLYDLFRVTGRKDVKKDIEECIETLKKNLHKYDLGYWSIYDQLKKELVRYYYQKNVHVPQLQVLYLLTKENIFKFYYEKWAKQINSLNFTFVKFMYRIRPRVLRLKNILAIQ